MKSEFLRTRVGRALLMVLCSFSFAAVAGATSFDCPPRTANVLYLGTASWSSDLVVGAQVTDADLRTSNCAGHLSRATVRAGGAVLVEDFDQLLCTTAPIGVVQLEVLSGCATAYRTEASYRDTAGNTNAVSIPELPEPLERNAVAEFSEIQNSGERATFIAFLPGAPGSMTRAKLTIYDGSNELAGEEIVNVEGDYVFYEIETDVRIGRVEIENIGAGVGPVPDESMYAIAFSGYRRGGSPRVILPAEPFSAAPPEGPVEP